MSHFLTIVLVDKNIKNIEPYVKESLAPFNEQDERYCEEEVTLCSCIKNGQIDFECDLCKGLGEITEIFNPQAQWDWWVIGGRWDGWIFGEKHFKASMSKDGFNIGDNHCTLKNNMRLVNEIISCNDDWYVPYAVTINGIWYSIDDSIDNSDWKNKYWGLLKNYQDHIAVAVDCHI